jgi:hypothetical protein
LSIRITNPSNEPRRVIGIPAECHPNACFQAKTDGPFTVAAGSSAELIVILKISGSGPFRVPMSLFFDENGLREAKWTGHGVAVAQGSPNGRAH